MKTHSASLILYQTILLKDSLLPGTTIMEESAGGKTDESCREADMRDWNWLGLRLRQYSAEF